ncbi:tripartite tricarboxylate transporter TctB family protein [Agrococcus carbonis]|uniref:Putative tricarboxylic transport membrane protein n=1 Tax=Agrococcus carbonis TaxID=684552 RepID=A0A1H1RLV9_9MICO|nr:tripartite tricarboxylate transporter TctB family protein [Agrococcus carbonis]SDS36633.1 putative tricarboxylic transport membrane protein [Agrococcus carbonis]
MTTHDPLAPESAAPAAGPGAGPSAGTRRWPELLLAVAVLATGAVTIIDGMGQPASRSASGLGAGQFPIIVGTLTAVLGAILLVQVLRGRLGHPDAAEGDVDVTRVRWWQLALAAAAMVGFALTVDVLGYPIAAAATFVAVAAATGARRWLVMTATAIVLSLGIFYLFTLALRIQLPAGLLAGIL